MKGGGKMHPAPIVTIAKKFQFDSAHHLPMAPEGHKCREPHGHTYTVEVEVKGAVTGEHGWLVDYGEISRLVKPLVSQLDHADLNEIEGLTYTTAEELCAWFWERLKPDLPPLHRVSIMETPNTRCDFYGDYA